MCMCEYVCVYSNTYACVCMCAIHTKEAVWYPFLLLLHSFISIEHLLDPADLGLVVSSQVKVSWYMYYALKILGHLNPHHLVFNYNFILKIL